MPRLAWILFAALVAALLGGCAPIPGVPNTGAPERLATYKRVGVISITVQEFSRINEGMLSVEREKIDSSSWDIDPAYEKQIADELSSIGGFEPVVGSYSRPDFFRLGYQGGSGFNWDGLQGPVKDYCSQNRVDAIVVAFAAFAGDFFAGTHQRIGGAGFLASSTGSRGYLHLITVVALYDCQAAKPVAARGLASRRDGLPGDILRASPVMAGPVELARTPLKQLGDAQVAAIKSSLVALPGKSWKPTLSALFGK